MKLLNCLLIVSVLLAVAFAGNILPAPPYMLNENAAELPIGYPSDVNSSGSYRILHPDGRIQIVKYGANNNGYVKHEEASHRAQAYEARSLTTSRPYITTPAPEITSAKDYKVPVSVDPAFEKQTPFISFPYPALISVITSPYGPTSNLPTSSPFDDPTFVNSNVDLSTLFRETASRKFLRL